MATVTWRQLSLTLLQELHINFDDVLARHICDCTQQITKWPMQQSCQHNVASLNKVFSSAVIAEPAGCTISKARIVFWKQPDSVVRSVPPRKLLPDVNIN